MDMLVEEYLDYNIDEDPSGSQGISIASDISKRCGYDLKKVKQLVKNYEPKKAELENRLKRLGKAILEKSLSKPVK